LVFFPPMQKHPAHPFSFTSPDELEADFERSGDDPGESDSELRQWRRRDTKNTKWPRFTTNMT